MAPFFMCLLSAQVALTLASDWKGAHDYPSPQKKNLELVFEWNLVDFTWPSKNARDEAIRNGEYDPKNTILYDVNPYNQERYFVALPRWTIGSPATLATISNKTKHGQYLLTPFPNWHDNRQGNCNGLTNVARTQIDKFGRLWVLDTGAVNIFVKLQRICQPQILVYDLTAGDKLIGRYRIPDAVLDCNSQLLDFQVDIRNNQRDDVFVYMNDILGFHLIVFDLRHESFHRVTHKTFLPNPHEGDMYLGGIRVSPPHGIHSIALGPVCNGDRRVYYNALASLDECYVMASTIRSEVYKTNERAYPDSFYCFSKKKVSQTAIGVTTEDGIMFYNVETPNAVACWNTIQDYNMENSVIVAQNDTTLQGVSSFKVVGKDLYVVSSRIQLLMLGGFPEDEINFRVFRVRIEDLIYGTPCEFRSHGRC